MKKLLTTSALVAAIALPQIAAADAHSDLDPNAKSGGNITVTYKDDVATLDPAIGYDWQNWSMIKSLYDGLMDYEPGTTELRPGLAESYDISEDGKVFTFKLREGVKFHNGRVMTADDVKYSLDRVTNPATQSPGAGFFGSIEGYDAVSSGEVTELSGVKVLDEQTVEITLSRPDATFLHVMGLNFASVVAKEAVEAAGADFGKTAMGTGAFKLADWTIGQKLVFEKNQDYWREGLPYLDSVTFEVGQEPIVALLRLQNGEVDVPGDGIPPAKFQEVMGDPEQAARVIEGGQLHTGYITLNVKMAPFDNVDVRKAVNMAINKERITQVINGRAVPATQPLPPSMPGYTEGYEGYPYDPEAAKALLAEAGFSDGFETELFVMNTDPNPRIAQAIQQDLSKIGVKATIQSLAQASVIAAGGEADQAPMIWSGGMAWIADFPDASNFYGPILGCDGAVQGGWNWSWYCNADADAMAVKADSMTDPAMVDERLKMWSDVYMAVMEDAPWVPVFNEQRYTMKSERMGGDDKLYVDPVSIPVNYDYVYVNDVQ
ncbi:MAG: ABC transporter substrate-binding protein [Sulfitobacter litoralis]|jgi:peptide/nickel transport system substrate-binding protein/oligopeptide transport system substrate-binding protein|uniref:Peptide/nickel transport system substrate-binding protein n=1 Tax=Sulfitobacter litoralis TaxID=335975 RepID=A0ABY0SZC9_9RHOB|nr:ABC transporter substrate-binding protein [Sulfitobacter litoralis]MBQ0718270.1 ABC transporter substrate-binding protein [Sulfitobacter litoralis]MBQ0800527.1 ABC transporter substrate-binding protein [Sulfitobacter litoralis]SDP77433.1 peptide/nickel transport system substrate-binding protein [Sulfitobacter litoralis]|tara:strand:- start:2740 stop:4380 length:1641 start_codon:yes stop_codon:yes gene_type:complete